MSEAIPCGNSKTCTKSGSIKPSNGRSTFLSGQLTNNENHEQFHSTRNDYTLSYKL